jgi:hypothetical protein
MHGGRSPFGINHPTTKHGRYSRYLPDRLAGRYLEAQSDGELTSLREEVALIDARLADVLGRVDSNEAGTLWAAIGKAVGGYREAEAEGTAGLAKRAKAIDLIEGLCSEGREDYAAWAEVLELIERRRKLAETETKRLAALGQLITAERAMLLLAAVVDVVRRHVDDRDALAAISRDVVSLVAVGAEPAADPEPRLKPYPDSPRKRAVTS